MSETITLLSQAEMQAAFAARDRSFDGQFVVGVTSTHIYCRPSCPARRPKPENTQYLQDNAVAELAGFRPCKRCKPDEVARDRAGVELAISILRHSNERVSLAQLADECGYSAAHFQRVFLRATGLSPASYGRALREERAREALSDNGEVTSAIYEAGFSGASQFYQGMKGRLGMAPSVWSKGGEGTRLSWVNVETSLGQLLIAASDKGVCRVAFDEGEEELRARFPKAELGEGDAGFSALAKQIVAVVEEPSQSVNHSEIPLDVRGTAFQERVWAELMRIPAGETRSYGELAAALGNPKASRAVGGANGANPIAVLVPCHRVIAADGGLGGYAYGEEIKRELLDRESAPKK